MTLAELLDAGVQLPGDARTMLSHVCLTSGNCTSALNSSASVITAYNSKWMECYPSGYINSTHYGHKSFKSCV